MKDNEIRAQRKILFGKDTKTARNCHTVFELLHSLESADIDELFNVSDAFTDKGDLQRAVSTLVHLDDPVVHRDKAGQLSLIKEKMPSEATQTFYGEPIRPHVKRQSKNKGNELSPFHQCLILIQTLNSTELAKIVLQANALRKYDNE